MLPLLRLCLCLRLRLRLRLCLGLGLSLGLFPGRSMRKAPQAEVTGFLGASLKAAHTLNPESELGLELTARHHH